MSDEMGIRGVGTDNLPPEQRSILRLEDAQRRMVVNITGDGRTVFGPGYTSPEAAAKLFWECIGSEYASMRISLNELMDFIEGHKALKNADPVQAVVVAKTVLGR